MKEICFDRRQLRKLLKNKAEYFQHLGSYLITCKMLITLLSEDNKVPLGFPPTEEDHKSFVEWMREGLEEENSTVKVTEETNGNEREERLITEETDPNIYEKRIVEFVKAGKKNFTKIQPNDLYSFNKVWDFCYCTSDLYTAYLKYRSYERDKNLGYKSRADVLGTYSNVKAYELIGYWTAKLEEKKKHAQRISKSRESVHAKKTALKQRVLNVYYSKENIPKEMKPHTAARIIQGSLRMKEPPSLDSIKRYLKEEGLI